MDEIVARLYSGDYTYKHVVVNGDTGETTVVFGRNDNKKEQYKVTGINLEKEDEVIAKAEKVNPSDLAPKFKKDRKKEAKEVLKNG